jgi:hypothetical protein
VAGDETKFEKSDRAMKFLAIFLIAPALSVLALALLETRVIYPRRRTGRRKALSGAVTPLRLERISLAGFDRGVSPTGFGFAVIRLLTRADLIR